MSDIDAPAARQITVNNHSWPRGWEAWKLGFHVTLGCAAAICLLVWGSKAIKAVAQMMGLWA